MKPRRHAFGLKTALSAGLFCLGLNKPALAQDDPAAPAADTKPTEPAPETPKPADPPAAESKPEEKKADSPEKAAPTPAEPTTPAEPAGDPEREKSVRRIGLEQLPGSAFPEPKPRGIKGGSLGFTMQGYQWPYMPMIAGEPATRVGISGSVWNDLSYARIVSGFKAKENSVKRWATQTRGVLRITPTHSTDKGWFAQGQAELVAMGDMSVPQPTLGSTDDLYVRFGKWNLFDLTVGRFQAWELAHYGMGLDLNTLERNGARIAGMASPPGVYGLSYLWDRQDYLLGYYALHAYPTKFLRFELLSSLGAGYESGTPQHAAGIRPMGILDFGFVKLKAGYEYSKAIPQEDDRPPVKDPRRNRRVGYGAALQFVLNPYIEAGGHYAIGMEDVRDQFDNDDLSASNTTWSMGGFLNGRVVKDFIVGGGAYLAHWEDLQPNGKAGPRYGEVDTRDQFFSYFALQYGLWDSIYFKFVGSHAFYRFRDFSETGFSNNMLGGRFRMMVLF